MGKSLEDRLLSHIDKTATCWLWTGTTGGSGARYGYTTVNGKKLPAHRATYELWVGKIPEGMELDHVKARGCTSKLCVNPAHLEPVTHAENRRRARLETCRAGLHDLTDPANVRWDDDGNRRGCLPCHREGARIRMNARYRARKGK